jgi:hypothetical protein
MAAMGWKRDGYKAASFLWFDSRIFLKVNLILDETSYQRNASRVGAGG